MYSHNLELNSEMETVSVSSFCVAAPVPSSNYSRFPHGTSSLFKCDIKIQKNRYHCKKSYRVCA